MQRYERTGHAEGRRARRAVSVLTLALVALGVTHVEHASAQPAGWSHSALFHVTNSANAPLPGTQVPIPLDIAGLVTAGEMLAGGADVRVAADCANQATFVPVWVESNRVWAKVDLPATGANLYVYWGNPAATTMSDVLSVLDSDDGMTGTVGNPFSSTNYVSGGASGGVTNSQRGIRFRANEDVYVVQFGKNEPNGNTRYVTLFDEATQQIIRQEQVSGPAGQYAYKDVTPFWLTAGTTYVLQIYQGASDGYYYGPSTSQINSRFTYIDMRYCNGCDQNTFPQNYLNTIHYGYPDIRFLGRRNQASITVGAGGLDTASCDVDGTVAECGDTHTNTVASEACDDGNAVATDDCLPTCVLPSCGDGVVHAGVEGCDDMNADETDMCLATCVLATCGDGHVQANVEACDDANLDETDDCLSTCALSTCGDGHLHAGAETCDDGNTSSGDSCLATCVPATCGDGFTWVGVEGCDDANDIDIDSCRRGCISPTCGDSFLQPGELCEDGNTVDTDGCTNSCMYALCGDGKVRTGVEACDDGNTAADDGCSPTCTVEVMAADGGVGDGGKATPPKSDGGCNATSHQNDPLAVMLLLGAIGMVVRTRRSRRAR